MNCDLSGRLLPVNETGTRGRLLTGLVVALILGFAPLVMADAGVVTGNGQNLRQITSETVQLVSIDVVITPGRGRLLFDGTVPGMDQVEYLCTFVLRNLTDKPAEVQVGFPIDSEFVPDRDKSKADKDDAKDWVLSYGFIARDEKTTYHIDFVRHEAEQGKPVSRAIFSWKMSFAPKETKALSVRYRIPMSMAVGLTRKDKDIEALVRSKKYAKEWMWFLNEGLVEFAGYITETGSTWAGKVEKAKFTVITAPFERYLNYRGFDEKVIDEMRPDDAARQRRFWPVHQAWWYKSLKPEGFKVTANGVTWEYQDFKPKDAIEVQYFITKFPRTPQAVPVFIDAILKFSTSKADERANPIAELETVREVILATYGKEPENEVARNYVKEQAWYQPQKDFAVAKLTKDQQAVLQEFDRVVSAMKKGK